MPAAALGPMVAAARQPRVNKPTMSVGQGKEGVECENHMSRLGVEGEP